MINANFILMRSRSSLGGPVVVQDVDELVYKTMR